MNQASVSTGQPASARQPRRQVSHSVSVVSVKVSTSHEDGSRTKPTNLRQEHENLVASHEDSRDRYGKNTLQQTTAITEKTVRLFLSSKAVVSSKPVNKPSSISSKTVFFFKKFVFYSGRFRYSGLRYSGRLLYLHLGYLGL